MAALAAYQPQVEDSLEGGDQQTDDKKMPDMLKLEQIAGGGVDLAFLLPDDKLQLIAQQCTEGFDRDKSERTEWEGEYDRVMAMASGERQPKTFPWPNAANIKYPLIMTAALQFGARAYPAIVRGKDVVKVTTTGDDADGEKRERAERVASHMNWQLLEDMPEWEEETDKLVHMLPVMGCVFRQVIWDATYTRPKTSLVSAKDLVVSQNAKDLETVPLFCKVFELFPHEIIERMRIGVYVDVEDKLKWTADDKGKPEDMLECHCRYDLDEDGYDEPWIAIVHKESGRLLSMKPGFWPKGVERGEDGKVRRVRRHVEFIKYGFVPDFRGRFLDVGFGFLLGEHNTIINTIINQLLDAATDQNAGGGFIGNGVSLKGGVLEFSPGEWKQINAPGGSLKDNVVARPTSQPSPVLFELLGTMVEAGKEVASVRDVLTGEAKANQPATTTLAIIEQGLQVFSSIYKRIYRALGKELGLIYQLNGAYLPDQAYFSVLDNQQAIAKADYEDQGHDVKPVADPSVTTSAQRLAKAQFLAGFVGNPMVSQPEILRRMMQAAEIEEIDKLLVPPDPKQQAIAERAAGAEVAQGEGKAMDLVESARLKRLQGDQIVVDSHLNIAAALAGLGEKPDDGSGMGSMGGMDSGGANAALPPPPGAPQQIPQIPMGGGPVPSAGGPANGAVPGPPGQIPGL